MVCCVATLLLFSTFVVAQRPAIVLEDTAKLRQERDCTKSHLFGDGMARSYTATCYWLTMPMDHSGNITKETFDYFVLCLSARSAKPKKTMFINQGGPGLPGSLLYTYTDLFTQEAGGLDASEWRFCFPDHRGTGESNQLRCDDGSHALQNLTVGPSEECFSHLQDTQSSFMSSMTVRNAAMDLWVAVNTISPRSNDTYLYGVSYGTTLLLKYLTFAPSENVAGVILDSPVPNFLIQSHRQMEHTNLVAIDYLTKCGLGSEMCAYCLGQNPVQTLDVIFQELEQGVNFCQKQLLGYYGVNLTAAVLRDILGDVLGTVEYRELLAPIVSRLYWCTDADIMELSVLVAAYEQLAKEDDHLLHYLRRRRLSDVMDTKDFPVWGDGESESGVTYWLIMSQLVPPHTPSRTELRDRTNGIFAGRLIEMPRYMRPGRNESDIDWYALPNLTSTDMLILSGQLDDRALAVGGKYIQDNILWRTTNTSATFKIQLLYLNTAHAVMEELALYSDRIHCPGQVLSHFVQYGEVLTDQVSECFQVAVDYDGAQRYIRDAASGLFGSRKVWGSCEKPTV